MRFLLIFLFLLLSLSAKAQNETNNWYFGNKAGLNFGLGKVAILNDGEMDTPAGCTTISDKEGKLLFYTNGKTVWNKNHDIMENGEALSADIENTQTSIIIPKPGSEEVYFLFTTKIASSTNPLLGKGLYLSEIEISDTYPLGNVVSKFQALRSDSTERITAVHNNDGTAIWVITFGSISSVPDSPKNTFTLYKIDKDGIGAPLVSTQQTTASNKGAMKASPNGKFIAIADYTERNIDLYNFNNETGEISLNQQIFTDTALFSPKFPYGLEFSPNSETLFYSGEVLPSGSSSINRYFLVNPFPNNPIFNLKRELFASQNDNFGTLQLANNGKIYASSYILGQNSIDFSDRISIIPNPDNLNPDINHLTLDLESGSSYQGLPNFIQSYFRNRITVEDNCVVEEFDFEIDAYTTISDILWEFGDGNTATEISPKHTYSSAGEYLITANITLNGQIYKVFKSLEVFPLPSLNENIIITQCDDDFDGLSSFNLFSAREDLANFTSLRNVNFSFFLSESDAINDVDAITSPQNFKNTEPNQQLFAKVRTLNGCTDITSFNVTASFIQLGNITDTFSCESTGPNAILNESLFDRDELIMKIRNELSLASDVSLRLFPGYEDSLNNLNEIFFNFSSPSTTIYIKIVEPDFSCGGIANMSLIVNPKPSINLDELYTICFNPNAKPPIIISAGENNDSFEWRNSQGNIIETEKDFELSSVGEFSLTAYKTENGILCSNTEFFTVINPLKANFERIEVNTEDEQNNIVSVVVLGNSTYEFSIDNINFFGNNTSYTFNNVEAGLRTIYVRDINNCEQPIETKVTVIGFKKFFTPNGDGENDFWNIKGIDAASFKSINVKIFDRYGKVIGTITNFDSPGWDGIYNGKNLIANNYWFKSVIIDKDDNIIENSGNFSLIRN